MNHSTVSGDRPGQWCATTIVADNSHCIKFRLVGKSPTKGRPQKLGGSRGARSWAGRSSANESHRIVRCPLQSRPSGSTQKWNRSRRATKDLPARKLAAAPSWRYATRRFASDTWEPAKQHDDIGEVERNRAKQSSSIDYLVVGKFLRSLPKLVYVTG